ncbi:hypothetical protein [Actinokineospora enzanensis]|uniref:hypothetical protein n=1 Tax=Actinokineospora enzanensis TaxID=155975 RepID=UPI000382E4DA|nr:hypothetical protein [Actinokineospora enzanensis]
MADDGDLVRNVLSGHAQVALQVGRVGGDLHLHGGRDIPAPRMVVERSPHFTNQVRALAEADAHWDGADRARPVVIAFVGLPGVGKTEVVRAWLGAHADEFPDGQFHADLSAGTRVDGVESTVLREFLLAVGFESGAISDTPAGRAAAFRSWSHGRRVAVVVEDVLAAPQVRMLMPAGAGSVVLVTAPGRISGLGVEEQLREVDLSPLEPAAARELLGRIARFERIRAEPQAVDALVELCAGLPIALCVAGTTLAEYPKRSIARLVAELEDRRRRLAVLSRTTNHSVAAVFDSACERLGETSRQVYRLLGAHPGPGDVHLDTVAAVLGLDTWDVRDAADELLRAGLAQENVEDRLSLHELVHLHAWTKADQDGVAAELAAAVDTHYHHVGVAAGHAMLPSRPWRDQLAPHLAAFDALAPVDPVAWSTAERVNLLGTVRRAAESEYQDRAWELALMLWPLHERGKYLDDLALAGSLGAAAAERRGRTDVAAVLRTQEGFAALHRGDPAAAYALFRTALDADAVPEIIATATESLGLAALALDRRAEAADLLRRNLSLAETVGDPRRIALARMHLSKAVTPTEAIALLTAAHAYFETAGPTDAHNVAKCDLLRGIAETATAAHSDAATHLAQALDLLHTLARPYDEAHAWTALGDLATTTHDPTAADCYRRALIIAETYGHQPRARELHTKLADLVRGSGHPRAQPSEF